MAGIKLPLGKGDFERITSGPTGGELVAKVAALEDKWAALDVRLTCMESLLKETDSDEFEQFYKKYPHKKAPRDAVKAFKAARKRAGFEDIMAGLVKYIRHKPSEQKYAYPATWLNQDRWQDDYPESPTAPPGEPKASTAGPNTAAAVEALSALMAPAEAVQVREWVCIASTDMDISILVACDATEKALRARRVFYKDSQTNELARWQQGYRRRITAAANHLGFNAPVWPKVTWND